MTSTSVDLSEVTALELVLDSIALFCEDETTDDEGLTDPESLIAWVREDLTINLLDFQNGRTVTLASMEVSAGDYRKLRLYVLEATLVVPDPDEETLEIRYKMFVPSKKVDIPVAFTVTGGEDVEPARSFARCASYGWQAPSFTRPGSTPCCHRNSPFVLSPALFIGATPCSLPLAHRRRFRRDE